MKGISKLVSEVLTVEEITKVRRLLRREGNLYCNRKLLAKLLNYYIGNGQMPMVVLRGKGEDIAEWILDHVEEDVRPAIKERKRRSDIGKRRKKPTMGSKFKLRLIRSPQDERS